MKKKMILLTMLIPLLGICQQKNIISTTRVFAKMDKVLEFEKGLATHAQKYHKSDWKWRVYAIESGPDAGGYQITEGPNSWDQLDGRGDLGQEHTIDWNKSVAIHLTDKTSMGYYIYQDSLSSVPLLSFSDKINITHVYPKIGRTNKVKSLIEKLRKVWLAAGESNAVYQASSSGPAQYTIVTRYQKGLKERDANFRKPFRERYEAIFGVDSYNELLEFQATNTDNVWSELLSFRADISSK